MRTQLPLGLAVVLFACGHGGDTRITPEDPTSPSVAHAQDSANGGHVTHELPGPIPPPRGTPPPPIGERLELTDAQWRQRLTAKQYEIMREQGTEMAFTGAYWDNHDPGVYSCAACGAPLFDSRDKFDSGTGWPSYSRPIESGRVAIEEDDSIGMTRNEVHCARCGAHLGHVFDDGPPPTNQRYCIDSVSLAFSPR